MNYIELERRLPSRYKHYLFIDDPNCSASSVFAVNGLRIKVKEYATRDDLDYRLIFCDVRKKDEEKFKKSMQDLINKMYLIGKTDYEEVATRMLAELTQE